MIVYTDVFVGSFKIMQKESKQLLSMFITRCITPWTLNIKPNVSETTRYTGYSVDAVPIRPVIVHKPPA